jgi:ankyrin repeat protein
LRSTMLKQMAAKKSVAAAASEAVKPATVDDPSPVKYLKCLFNKTDEGRDIVLNPRRSHFTKPSKDVTDSYDMEVVRAIRERDLTKLRSMLSEGKSFDASNRFGETLMHMACRRGCVEIVNFLIHEARVKVDVRDDLGRSALHDACWTTEPNFDVMDVLMKQFPLDMLLSEDVRGHTPFHYARKEHWDDWVAFLRERDNFLLRRLDLLAETIA